MATKATFVFKSGAVVETTATVEQAEALIKRYGVSIRKGEGTLALTLKTDKDPIRVVASELAGIFINHGR